MPGPQRNSAPPTLVTGRTTRSGRANLVDGNAEGEQQHQPPADGLQVSNGRAAADGSDEATTVSTAASVSTLNSGGDGLESSGSSTPVL